MRKTFAVGIGGAAGQGVATPGDIFAKIFSRRGLHLNAYNAYQSIIRGGHTFLTIRTGPEKVTNMGDRVDLLIDLFGYLSIIVHGLTILAQSMA